MNLLEINNLRKSFGDLAVIKDISLAVREGQVVSIIGPSGSGKSTLLRCATMLEKIDAGSISYLGEPLVTTGENSQPHYVTKEQLKKIRSYYGLVFQNFNLFPHYSVIKNVIDPLLHVIKMNREEAHQIGRDLLHKMGLADKENAYPGELSGGQQQRVSIARALALHPKVLFFDEPTSALDPELTGDILKILKKLASEKMTMVIVTHEMNFARDISDYIIFMDGGVIVEEGEKDQVIHHPQQDRTKAFLSNFNF
jgi:polar amino acid transport system ATP-binding protein